MTASAPLPIGLAELDALRRRARKRLRTSGTGAILRRSLGQSLEYREHRAYIPGDDVRHIDWRASARRGLEGQYLVRAYEAEEQFSLLVLVDNRPTMRLPAVVPKLTFALWIAECLAHIAALEGINAAFLPLYSASGARRGRFMSGDAVLSAYRAMEHEFEAVPSRTQPVLKPGALPALRGLPPCSATVLISDFYMPEFEEVLQLVTLGRRGARQVVLCELDTWPHERAMLEGQMVRLAGVGDLAGRPGDFEPTTEQLAEAERQIEARRQQVPYHRTMKGVIRQTWHAPSTPFDMAAQFRDWFPRFLRDSEILGGQA